MELSTLYKRLIVIIILALPIYWMVLTPHGQHTIDVIVLKMAGGDVLEIDLNDLSSAIDETRLSEMTSTVDLECEERDTSGARYCQAKIATFNKLPSQRVTFILQNNRLLRMKVNYRRSYHDSIINYLLASHGAPQNTPSQPAMKNPISQWKVNGGAVVTLQELNDPNAEAAIIWQSNDTIR